MSKSQKKSGVAGSHATEGLEGIRKKARTQNHHRRKENPCATSRARSLTSVNGSRVFFWVVWSDRGSSSEKAA